MVVGLWLLGDLVAHLGAERLWFEELGFLATFYKRVSVKILLWFIATGVSGVFLWGNLTLAARYRWGDPEGRDFRPPPDDPPQSPTLTLFPLIFTTLGFCLLIGLMFFYDGEVAWKLGHVDFRQLSVTPTIPAGFTLQVMRDLLHRLWGQWQMLLVLVVLLGILWRSLLGLRLLAVVLSLIFGFVVSGNWFRVLQAWHPTPFGTRDPLYGFDIGFYIFELPIWQLLDFWLGGLFLYGLTSITLVYLLSGDSLSQGQFPGFSRRQLRHLYSLSALFLLTVAGRHLLHLYELFYSTQGIIYGASFTGVRVQRWTELILGINAGAIAFSAMLLSLSDRQRKAGRLPRMVWFIFCYLGLSLGSQLLIFGVQKFIVQPNELVREGPYLQYSIAATRQAFGLDRIDAQLFDPSSSLDIETLKKNQLTLGNIRLWDSRPLLQSNRQLQQIRLYYRFPDADIDRYYLPINLDDPPEKRRIEKQQVFVSPRELDFSLVPPQAKTWVNEHLVYTHGYGFTMSPVNRVKEGGLPEFYVQDISTENGNQTRKGRLKTASPEIAASIPIDRPRIYYGELTNTYALTSGKVQELDFPSGDSNEYNTYDGRGGIPLNSFARRWIFAEYLNDWRLFFANAITRDTKILLRRNINYRVRAIAPFLRYDRDPYLVVADGGDTTANGNPTYLYWILDAYTTTDHYPYADPGNHKFNYIRNSVKVVINAYNGNVRFYVADDSDPLIKTWQKVFPELFSPLAAMPMTLRTHVRYPEDFFTVQSERLLTYHMIDSQVFYNREDQWAIPQEIYGRKAQQVKPYSLIMKLPTAAGEEFVLLHPYTPTRRSNLIAWLAARADGKQYGKLLLYQFPKERLIYGPNQVEALINQDPIISQQISLWNRQGSRAIQGNLLIIPIEQSLLYVEPLYLEAEQDSVPILARVVVVYENRIVMAKRLDEALQVLFDPNAKATEPIVRSVEQSIN